MTQTLLEKAKQVHVQAKRWQNCGNEDVELALGWLKGDVNFKQVSEVKGLNGSNVYNYLTSALVMAYHKERLKIKGKTITDMGKVETSFNV